MKRKLTIIGAALSLTVGVGIVTMPTAMADTTIQAGYSNGDSPMTPAQPGKLIGLRFWVQASGDYAPKNLKVEGCNEFLKVVGPDPSELKPGERTYIYCGYTSNEEGWYGANLLMGDDENFKVAETHSTYFEGPAVETVGPERHDALRDGMDAPDFEPIDGGLNPSVRVTPSFETATVTDTHATALVKMSATRSDLDIGNPTIENCEFVSGAGIWGHTDLMTPGTDFVWECTFPLTEDSKQTKQLPFRVNFSGLAVGHGDFSAPVEGTLQLPGDPVEPDPTEEPTTEPTTEPTEEPTVEPTTEPTDEPTVEPTEEPTAEPTTEPTVEPTEEPTVEPTEEPTVEPTAEPTEEPTVEPTTEPTAEPTEEPTVIIEPTEEPTAEPTTEPTDGPPVIVEPTPTAEPTPTPTSDPTEDPADMRPVAVMVSGPSDRIRVGQSAEIGIVVANATDRILNNIEVSVEGCSDVRTESDGTLEVGARAVFTCTFEATEAGEFTVQPLVTVDGEQVAVDPITLNVVDAEPTAPTTEPTAEPTVPSVGGSEPNQAPIGLPDSGV